jgi:hypothetical protein
MADTGELARELVLAFLSHAGVADRFVVIEQGTGGMIADPTATGSKIGELYLAVRKALDPAKTKPMGMAVGPGVATSKGDL